MSRARCRYCHRLPLGACRCCCVECESPAPRIRRFMDMDSYDPSPYAVQRRVS